METFKELAKHIQSNPPALNIYAPWHFKRLKHFTLEDAEQAYKEGFCCVCSNGKIKYLTNDPDVV